MSSNLYPLILNTTVPANAAGNSFTVNFELNRATHQNDVKQIYGSVKTVQSGNVINNALKAIDWTIDSNGMGKVIFPPLNYTPIGTNYIPGETYYIYINNNFIEFGGDDSTIQTEYLYNILMNKDKNNNFIIEDDKIFYPFFKKLWLNNNLEKFNTKNEVNIYDAKDNKIGQLGALFLHEKRIELDQEPQIQNYLKTIIVKDNLGWTENNNTPKLINFDSMQEQLKNMMIEIRNEYSDDNIYYNYIRNVCITDLMLKQDEKNNYKNYMQRLKYAHLLEDITNYYFIKPYIEVTSLEEERDYYKQDIATQILLTPSTYIKNKYYVLDKESETKDYWMENYQEQFNITQEIFENSAYFYISSLTPGAGDEQGLEISKAIQVWPKNKDYYKPYYYVASFEKKEEEDNNSENLRRYTKNYQLKTIDASDFSQNYYYIQNYDEELNNISNIKNTYSIIGTKPISLTLNEFIPKKYYTIDYQKLNKINVNEDNQFNNNQLSSYVVIDTWTEKEFLPNKYWTLEFNKITELNSYEPNKYYFINKIIRQHINENDFKQNKYYTMKISNENIDYIPNVYYKQSYFPATNYSSQTNSNFGYSIIKTFVEKPLDINTFIPEKYYTISVSDNVFVENETGKSLLYGKEYWDCTDFLNEDNYQEGQYYIKKLKNTGDDHCFLGQISESLFHFFFNQNFNLYLNKIYLEDEVETKEEIEVNSYRANNYYYEDFVSDSEGKYYLSKAIYTDSNNSSRYCFTNVGEDDSKELKDLFCQYFIETVNNKNNNYLIDEIKSLSINNIINYAPYKYYSVEMESATETITEENYSNYFVKDYTLLANEDNNLDITIQNQYAPNKWYTDIYMEDDEFNDDIDYYHLTATKIENSAYMPSQFYTLSYNIKTVDQNNYDKYWILDYYPNNNINSSDDLRSTNHYKKSYSLAENVIENDLWKYYFINYKENDAGEYLLSTFFKNNNYAQQYNNLEINKNYMCYFEEVKTGDEVKAYGGYQKIGYGIIENPIQEDIEDYYTLSAVKRNAQANSQNDIQYFSISLSSKLSTITDKRNIYHKQYRLLNETEQKNYSKYSMFGQIYRLSSFSEISDDTEIYPYSSKIIALVSQKPISEIKPVGSESFQIELKYIGYSYSSGKYTYSSSTKPTWYLKDIKSYDNEEILDEITITVSVDTDTDKIKINGQNYDINNNDVQIGNFSSIKFKFDGKNIIEILPNGIENIIEVVNETTNSTTITYKQVIATPAWSINDSPSDFTNYGKFAFIDEYSLISKEKIQTEILDVYTNVNISDLDLYTISFTEKSFSNTAKLYIKEMTKADDNIQEDFDYYLSDSFSLITGLTQSTAEKPIYILKEIKLLTNEMKEDIEKNGFYGVSDKEKYSLLVYPVFKSYSSSTTLSNAIKNGNKRFIQNYQLNITGENAFDENLSYYQEVFTLDTSYSSSEKPYYAYGYHRISEADPAKQGFELKRNYYTKQYSLSESLEPIDGQIYYSLNYSQVKENETIENLKTEVLYKKECVLATTLTFSPIQKYYKLDYRRGTSQDIQKTQSFYKVKSIEPLINNTFSKYSNNTYLVTFTNKNPLGINGNKTFQPSYVSTYGLFGSYLKSELYYISSDVEETDKNNYNIEYGEINSELNTPDEKFKKQYVLATDENSNNIKYFNLVLKNNITFSNNNFVQVIDNKFNEKLNYWYCNDVSEDNEMILATFPYEDSFTYYGLKYSQTSNNSGYQISEIKLADSFSPGKHYYEATFTINKDITAEKFNNNGYTIFESYYILSTDEKKDEDNNDYVQISEIKLADAYDSKVDYFIIEYALDPSIALRKNMIYYSLNAELCDSATKACYELTYKPLTHIYYDSNISYFQQKYLQAENFISGIQYYEALYQENLEEEEPQVGIQYFTLTYENTNQKIYYSNENYFEQVFTLNTDPNLEEWYSISIYEKDDNPINLESCYILTVIPDDNPSNASYHGTFALADFNFEPRIQYYTKYYTRTNDTQQLGAKFILTEDEFSSNVDYYELNYSPYIKDEVIDYPIFIKNLKSDSLTYEMDLGHMALRNDLANTTNSSVTIEENPILVAAKEQIIDLIVSKKISKQKAGNIYESLQIKTLEDYLSLDIDISSSTKLTTLYDEIKYMMYEKIKELMITSDKKTKEIYNAIKQGMISNEQEHYGKDYDDISNKEADTWIKDNKHVSIAVNYLSDEQAKKWASINSNKTIIKNEIENSEAIEWINETEHTPQKIELAIAEISTSDIDNWYNNINFSLTETFTYINNDDVSNWLNTNADNITTILNAIDKQQNLTVLLEKYVTTTDSEQNYVANETFLTQVTLQAMGEGLKALNWLKSDNSGGSRRSLFQNMLTETDIENWLNISDNKNLVLKYMNDNDDKQIIQDWTIKYIDLVVKYSNIETEDIQEASNNLSEKYKAQILFESMSNFMVKQDSFDNNKTLYKRINREIENSNVESWAIATDDSTEVYYYDTEINSNLENIKTWAENNFDLLTSGTIIPNYEAQVLLEEKLTSEDEDDKDKIFIEINGKIELNNLYAELLDYVDLNTAWQHYLMTINPKLELYIENNKFTIGQFYKLQLYYKNENDNPSIFSGVGVFKYSSDPALTVNDYQAQSNQNIYQNTVTGKYFNSGDVTEKVYTYKFTLLDNYFNILETSGELLHNSSTDISNDSSYDTYTFKTDLEKSGYIEYEINTINKINQKIRYFVKPQTLNNIAFNANLVAELDYDNGSVVLRLENPMNPSLVISGNYILSRAEIITDYKVWEPLYKFTLNNTPLNQFKYIDNFVAHGNEYIYSIQKIDQNGIYSNRIKSNNNQSIQVFFEDMFLIDSENQLKIKFNPKVTSFKNTLLEAKQDTLGGKYPYFFRNGNVCYKEFPISGLISYQMNSNNSFFKEENLNPFINATQLTDENIMYERKFKLKVLDWLTDGKPKYFKSPAEGNYVVRLMNISLSPDDKLGRMLHTFNCTAYEFAENSLDSMVKNNIFIIKEEFYDFEKEGKYDAISYRVSTPTGLES